MLIFSQAAAEERAKNENAILSKFRTIVEQKLGSDLVRREVIAAPRCFPVAQLPRGFAAVHPRLSGCR